MVQPFNIDWKKLILDWRDSYPYYLDLSENQKDIFKSSQLTLDQRAIALKMRVYYRISLRRANKLTWLYWLNYLDFLKHRKVNYQEKSSKTITSCKTKTKSMAEINIKDTNSGYPRNMVEVIFTVTPERVKKEEISREVITFNSFEELSSHIRKMGTWNWESMVNADGGTQEHEEKFLYNK